MPAGRLSSSGATLEPSSHLSNDGPRYMVCGGALTSSRVLCGTAGICSVQAAAQQFGKWRHVGVDEDSSVISLHFVSLARAGKQIVPAQISISNRRPRPLFPAKYCHRTVQGLRFIRTSRDIQDWLQRPVCAGKPKSMKVRKCAPPLQLKRSP